MASATRILQRRRRREARKQAAQASARLWAGIVIVAVLVLVVLPVSILLGGAAIMYSQATQDLPDPQATIYLDPIVGPTELYDRSGSSLLFSVQDPLGDQRQWIPLESLPPYLVDATLLMEDPNFLTRPQAGLGQGLVKLWQNYVDGPLPMDPTLTGRLVRNAIAPRGETPGPVDREREIALVTEIQPPLCAGDDSGVASQHQFLRQRGLRHRSCLPGVPGQERA